MRPVASTTALAGGFEPADVVVVDVRTPLEFAQGHPKGAISLPFSARGLDERLTVAADPGTPVHLVASQAPVASAALDQLGQSYLVVGVTDGNWRQAGVPEESLPDITIHALAEAVPGGDLTIVDVREPLEWDTGYAPGAILISLGNLREQLGSIPDQAPVAVICEAGVRSSTGASLLQAAGFTNVMTVSEGMSGYRRAGLPTEYPERQDVS